MNKQQKRNKVLTELFKHENWRPQYSKISRKTGIAVSTVHDIITQKKIQTPYDALKLSEKEVLQKMKMNLIPHLKKFTDILNDGQEWLLWEMAFDVIWDFEVGNNGKTRSA